MTAQHVSIAGTLQADGEIVLDQKPALPPGRVLVTIQAIPQGQAESVWTVIERIAAERSASQQPARTRAEIDAEIRQMREEWPD